MKILKVAQNPPRRAFKLFQRLHCRVIVIMMMMKYCLLVLWLLMYSSDNTVPCKCIGTTKEIQYQERFKQIAKLRNRGLEVPCHLKPEPDNPFDSNAIAFECQIDGMWQIIGYIVREALDEVHEALATKKSHQGCT